MAAPTTPGSHGAERVRVLSNGARMPVLGLGVWQIPDGPETVRAVRSALEVGYRHIDTAQGYGNERSVGRALRESGVPREEVFITTKFDPSAADPEAEAERSLERLGIDQLDLYLVHSPRGGPTWAWPGMERALERGLTRSIGVSNFDAGELETVIEACTTPPAVDQVQFSPFQYRRELLNACQRHGIALEAYSPLTSGRDLDHRVVVEVAERNGRTAAQILLRWALQRGVIVIPKSVHRERIVENLGALDLSLSEEDMANLDALDRTGGTGRALERRWWTRPARAKGRLRRLRRRVPR